MAKRKRRYSYFKNEDYLHLVTGTITKIIELNTEYKNHFKTVFSLNVPGINDKRFDTCISWDRWVIDTGDLIIVKGRYLQDAFLVKSLRILRKAQKDNLLLSNSPKGQEFETSPDKCTSSAKFITSQTAAQEDINGHFSNTT